MPLPDAEAPEESRLYEELKSKNALGGATGGNTAALMDALRLATFLDAENEDQLRRLLLIGQASGTTSSSGPIPGTSTTAYKNDVTSSGTRYNIFQPGPGEVWLLGPLSYQVGGASGTVTVEQWLYASDNIDGTKRRVLVGNSSTSGSGYNTIFEGGPNMPIHVDENGYVAFEATGTFTSVTVYLHLIRVR